MTKRFDLPFLLLRAGILRIKPKIYGRSYNELFGKYRHFYHTDLETVFTEHSLAFWGYVFGETQEIEQNGSKIAAMYEAGKMEDIIAKNTIDLVATHQIYKKLEWVGL